MPAIYLVLGLVLVTWIPLAVLAVAGGAWRSLLDDYSVHARFLVALPVLARLVATHPDRCGGLRPIGQIHQFWAVGVFAVSSVVSAHVGQGVLHGRPLGDFRVELIAFAGLSLSCCSRLFSRSRGNWSTPGCAACSSTACSAPSTPAVRHTVDRTGPVGSSPARYRRHPVARRPRQQ